jgi:hypothetical protein
MKNTAVHSRAIPSAWVNVKNGNAANLLSFFSIEGGITLVEAIVKSVKRTGEVIDVLVFTLCALESESSKQLI